MKKKSEFKLKKKGCGEGKRISIIFKLGGSFCDTIFVAVVYIAGVFFNTCVMPCRAVAFVCERVLV